MYIDVHCHLTGDEYDELGGVDGILKNATENGVGIVIASGFDLQSSYVSARISENYENVYSNDFWSGFHKGFSIIL